MFFKYLRKTAAFLVCLGLIAATGCESKRPQKFVDENNTSSVVIEDVTSQTPEENIKLLDDLGGKYKNRTYKIVTTNAALFKTSKNSETNFAQSPLEKAIGDRMDLLKNSFGIKFEIVVEGSERDVKENLRNAVQSGKPYADLLCVSAELMAELMEQGLLENMASLPYVDLDASYMHSQSISQQTVGNKLFFYSGDATLSMNSATVLFYNKEITDKAGLDPTSMVYNGSFTWDALSGMVNTAVKQKCFGIDVAVNNEELLYSIYASTNSKFITVDGDSLKASYNSERAKAVNRINAALFSDKKLCPDRVDPISAINDFKEGKSAFMVARLDSVARLSGTTVEWGILPLPKENLSQNRHVAPVNHVASCIAVPKNSEDSAFAGFMLNAFLAASTNGLDEGLKTTYINYYFWNNDSARMLELIEGNLSYDYGIFMSSLPQVYDVSTKLLTSDDNLNLKEEDEQFFYKFSDSVFG